MELVSCVICRFKQSIRYSSWDDVMETDYVIAEQLVRNYKTECTCGINGTYYTVCCFERTEKKQETVRSR